MKKQLISNALSQIDDEYIEEAENYKSKKKLYKYFFLPAAACLCLILGLNNTKSFDVNLVLSHDSTEEKIVLNGIMLPKTDIENYIHQDYICPFILHNEHYYFAYCQTENTDLIGDCLGTGEYLGNTTWKYYAVNGYNPDFMICVPLGDSYMLFINNNNYKITYGRDIFEDKLHMLDRCKYISYISHKDFTNPNITHEYWPKLISYMRSYRTPIRFLEEIMGATWNDSSQMIGDNEALYHIFYQLEDGITVRLVLYEGGYVEFEAFPGVCVQISDELLQKMIRYMEN